MKLPIIVVIGCTATVLLAVWWSHRKTRDNVFWSIWGIRREIRSMSMTVNQELQEIGAKLDEAAAELSGLPAQIDELIAQVGETADPELVASIKSKADLLANIVPNAPIQTPTEPTPDEPVTDEPTTEPTEDDLTEDDSES